MKYKCLSPLSKKCTKICFSFSNLSNRNRHQSVCNIKEIRMPPIIENDEKVLSTQDQDDTKKPPVRFSVKLLYVDVKLWFCR